MEQRQVPVTQANIDDGLPKCGPACPVAKALKDLDDIDGAWVTPRKIELNFGEKELKNSDELKNWIKAFDRGYDILPITLNLDFINSKASIVTDQFQPIITL